ncbi:type 1 glutamine amidotransferase domain-containing protein [Pseudohongiella sp. SYSU M77423]|uniref:type 1 glutamine amidotransferase domain-containing protein n=1 Tax=Pseudohongiella sp. SYSU M77423 TaxID=3042312 RepID=UPI002480788A|nr:type 1 glutamine amidotransferase domain-containing protein [Pseudohongiella sp. SYSU M77423]MDH7942950.1 type 1 glutamine amidotransferase domain-containing protein [Pseudohongiella sp. SYSU M77423]
MDKQTRKNDANEHVKGKKVAILVTNGFEQSEFTEPRQALDDAGAVTTVVSLDKGPIHGMHHQTLGDHFDVDKTIDQVNSDDFDALLIPGGVANPDALRGNEAAVAFARDFVKAGKPTFAICHGPQVLITAGVVKGRSMTSYKTVRIDLENAGAHWVDQSVVVDEGLVTSRSPKDIPDFNAKMLEELAEGRH